VPYIDLQRHQQHHQKTSLMMFMWKCIRVVVFKPVAAAGSSGRRPSTTASQPDSQGAPASHTHLAPTMTNSTSRKQADPETFSRDRTLQLMAGLCGV
jgi:hypothetical protein